MKCTPAPSKALVLAVRAGFIQKGTTLTAWCKANRINTSNARVALIGAWDGPKGAKLRAKIVKASGIEVAA
jgi:hypothetical protein